MTTTTEINLFDIYQAPDGIYWTAIRFNSDDTICIEDTETTEKKSVTIEELLSIYTKTDLI
jgi:hypothetical protein